MNNSKRLVTALVIIFAIVCAILIWKHKDNSNNSENAVSATTCKDFDTISNLVSTAITNDKNATVTFASTTEIAANTNIIESFRWKRADGEPYITYPIVRGTLSSMNGAFRVLSYDDIVRSMKSYSDAVKNLIGTDDWKKIGLTVDTKNSIPYQTFDEKDPFGDSLAVYAFTKGADLYNIVLKVEGGMRQAPPDGFMKVTCGNARADFDSLYTKLNLHAMNPAPTDPYDNDYVSIAAVSDDNKVYGLMGQGLTKIAAYYLFDGGKLSLVSENTYPTLCDPLEKLKVGRGMRCATSGYLIRTVTY